MRRSSNATALETINAAATAIASAENRAPQDTEEKRRWGGRWSVYWCFGSQKQKKRIGHSALVPDNTTAPRSSENPPPENPTQPSSSTLPFAAPPSSPASFLQSEPPSCSQSPGGLLSFTSISANMYSPGPASMFAIGPYAHETQLVSPPVFSTFNTEPSTAPFTPPPESVQFTTPSSPEVPFARLLDPYHRNNDTAAGQRFPMSQYEFQSYHLYPGSPVGQLISPSSGISNSGTSSPFPDREFTPGGQFGKLSAYERRSLQGSGSLTPDATTARRSRDGVLLNRQSSDISPLPAPFNGLRNDEVVDHRVSFEVTAEDVVRCMAKEPYRAKAKGEGPTSRREGHSDELHDSASEKASAEDEDGHRPQKHRSITLGSAKEFNFDSADGGNLKNPAVASEWWSEEKVSEKASASSKDWAFFPMMQPGVS